MTDLQELRDEVLAARTHAAETGSWYDQMSADGLAILFDRMAPPELRLLERVSDHSFRVQLRGREPVPSYITSAVTLGVQNATARLVRAVVDPYSAAGAKISPSDRERAALIQDRQLANTIYFSFPAPAGGPGSLPTTSGETAAAAAVRLLVRSLPGEEEDDAAVDAILTSEHAALRRAVKDVSDAARRTPGGLEFTLRSPARKSERSVLTSDRALALVEELGKAADRVTPITLRGKLDGLRGARHALWIITPDYPAGLRVIAEEDQISPARKHIGANVTAMVNQHEREAASGEMRTTYRLVHLEPHPTLPGIA